MLISSEQVSFTTIIPKTESIYLRRVRVNLNYASAQSVVWRMRIDLDDGLSSLRASSAGLGHFLLYQLEQAVKQT